MSLSLLLSKPCQIERRGASGDLDDYGDEVEAVEFVETTCALQQKTRAEPGDQGELSVTEWALFLPAGTAIDTSDRVVVGNHIYEVVGDPWDADDGSTVVWHVEASVKRVGTDVGS